jgi:hypothetical protein
MCTIYLIDPGGAFVGAVVAGIERETADQLVTTPASTDGLSRDGLSREGNGDGRDRGTGDAIPRQTLLFGRHPPVRGWACRCWG